MKKGKQNNTHGALFTESQEQNGKDGNVKITSHPFCVQRSTEREGEGPEVEDYIIP